MIVCIVIGASSTAEISLWDNILKEERKHLQKYHAAHVNPVASTPRAITESFGRFPAMQNFPLSKKSWF